jgi:hypothetical protein
MKINLAENLLRFGVKNLSESDYEKIQEQTAAKISIAPINVSRKFGTSATPVVINDLEGYLGVRTDKGAEYWFPSGKVVTCIGSNDIFNLLIGPAGVINDTVYTPKYELLVMVIALGNAVNSMKQAIANNTATGTKQAEVSTMKARSIATFDLTKKMNNTPYVAAFILKLLQIDMELRQSVDKVLLPKVVDIINLLNQIGVYSNTINIDTDKQTIDNFFIKMGGKLV